jgi:hypothetical protein
MRTSFAVAVPDMVQLEGERTRTLIRANGCKKTAQSRQ